jgi:pSer/pThr/pTyr-binding forkhead associated (FHA) protein
VIADVALPISYDWFLLGTRVVIALIMLGFLWRVMMVVGRDSLLYSPSAPQVSLALLDESDHPIRGFRLSRRKPLTIGRDATNDIVLTDRSVSGHHAVIRLMHGEWVLVDLDSRNGTYVNGSAVAAETSIAERDIVQFGAVRLQMVSSESPV